MKRLSVAGMCTAAAIWAATFNVMADPALSLEFDGNTLSFAPQIDGARTGFTRFMSVDAVSMEGRDGVAALVVELSLPPGARTGDTPHDARISYRPDGWRNYWVSQLDFPQGSVIIDHLDLSSQTPSISGKFAVALCFAATVLHVPDADNCLPASGQFNTVLVRD